MLLILQLAIPTLAATLVPILAGRAMARLGGRRRHVLAIGVIAALSLALGLLIYATHGAGVPAGRAVIGGVIAAVLLALIPLTVYFELGYWVRSRVGVGVTWLLLAAPAFVYALLVLISISTHTECTAVSQQECAVFS